MSYNLRQKANEDNTSPAEEFSPSIMANPVVMTQEQFQLLITSMTQAVASRAPPPAPIISSGNFSNCASRFSGNPGEDVEAFINAICIYKDCLNISEDNAVRGLPMLLDNQAATWWQGCKSTISTWKEILTALKHSFGHNMPPHQIFKELFSRQQGDKEPTDIFVNSARALLAHLPDNPKLHPTHQMDMIYGLLNRKIRCRLPREQISSFSELIEKARSIESSLHEFTLPTKQSKENDEKPHLRPKCQFCKNFGHIQTECRKFAAAKQSKVTVPSTSPKPVTTSTSITCFGCGTPGYIRSQCPNCRTRNSASTSLSSVVSAADVFTTDTSSLDILLTEVCSVETQSRPLVRVEIAGRDGLAYIDSGAKNSIAGNVLYTHFCRLNLPYKEQFLQMILADGQLRQVQAKIFETEVVLQGKKIPTTFLSVPDHDKSKTLLGVDFITKAGLIINIPRWQWFFEENPATLFDFFKEPLARNTLSSPAKVCQAEFQLKDVDGPHLTPDQKRQLTQLLQTHSTVFEKNKELTPYAEHCIKLTDDNPIYQPPYRLAPTQKEILRRELDKLLDDGIIEECESAYAAPVVLVPKPDGSTRLCVDYRRLNAVTVPVQYPLPRVDDLLHSTVKAAYITTLDLKSGYHQIPVKKEDRDKTSFVTPFGTFRYNAMPFGLRTAPATFQRLADRFSSGLPHVSILAYLDDLIIMSPTLEDHLKDLDDVFKRLKLFKLQVNRAKCTFAADQVKYLGHIITKDGFQPGLEKISAIMNMPAPQNIKQVLSFLQTCSWFRRFVPNFAEISRPLSVLTRKNSNWQWSVAQEEAFNKLKQLLTSAPILRQADSTKPFMIQVDASSYALGAALLQGEGDDVRPVEYASCLLTPAQKNYHTTEREALALVWAFSKFRGYIEGCKVIVKSDHQPLRWLMSLKAPTGRLARWALSLQPYDLSIEYVPGRQNVLADTLSRPICHDSSQGDTCDVCFVTVELPVDNIKEIREQQLADPDIAQIINCFESPETNAVDIRRWSDRGYLMMNGILYRYSPDNEGEEAQQVVPKSQIQKVLKETHDSPLAGHYGVERTLQRIAPRYYWTGMRRDITAYVAQCIDCQRYKSSNMKPCGLLQTPVQALRFEVISVDLFGPLPETSTNHKWIFIVEDTCSRWTELFPLKTATAEACARCLIDEIILRFGSPRKVISDNGVQFVSEIMQHVAQALDFTQSLTPVYHPAANPVERKNRDLKTQLAILTSNDHSSWKDKLPAIRFALNSSVCCTTGFTPAYLTFGRELRTPDDVRRDFRAIIENDTFVPQITPYLRVLANTLHQARENHERHQDDRKKYADSKRRHVTYNVSDLVLVNTHVLSKAKAGITSKFVPRRDGPYQISRVLSPTSYEVVNRADPDVSCGIYHVSALTPYVPPINETTQPVPVHPIRRRGRPRHPPLDPVHPIRRRGRPRPSVSNSGPSPASSSAVSRLVPSNAKPREVPKNANPRRSSRVRAKIS